jgi:hypothetical protein
MSSQFMHVCMYVCMYAGFPLSLIHPSNDPAGGDMKVHATKVALYAQPARIGAAQVKGRVGMD